MSSQAVLDLSCNEVVDTVADMSTDDADGVKVDVASAESMNRLLSMETIDILHQHKRAGAVCVVDIDETLVMTPQNCVMLTRGGLQAFESFCENSAMPKDFREQLYQRCRLMICRKILCEGNRTKDTIKALQDDGVWVLGLTARYATSAEDTDDMLSHFGLDLTVNCPLPSKLSLQDPETQAVYMNGVIYTNAVEKGTVLNRFLQNVVYRDHVFPEAGDSKVAGEMRRVPIVSRDGKATRSDTVEQFQEYVQSSSTPLPKEIIFCDDRKDNAESVFNNLTFARKFDIPLTCYHYTYTHTLSEKPGNLDRPEMVVEAVSAGPAKLMELLEQSLECALAVVQIAAFIKTEGMRLFNDAQAKALLEDIRRAAGRSQAQSVEGTSTETAETDSS